MILLYGLHSNLECVLNFYFFIFFVIQTWQAMRNMIAPADHALSTSFTHMTLRVNLTDCAAMTPLSVFLRFFLKHFGGRIVIRKF